MSIPPKIVSAARYGWQWQWIQLMKGLAPADENGNYKRIPSQKDNAKLPQEKDLMGRESKDFPTLIIGRSCPWAHRIWLIYEIRDLKNSLNLIFAEADHQGGQWIIEPSWLGCKTVLEIYNLCNTPPAYRATVPALVDPKPSINHSPQLLGNESAQLLELLNNWPAGREAPNLSPKNLKKEIDTWSNLLQFHINDGVYKCGFARNQNAYEDASRKLFEALYKVEKSLSSKGPWLCGDDLTIADLKLFPTLIRWESIYSPLFRCSNEPLWKFPNIWKWRQQFFQIPKVSSTCNSDRWREDYFGALFPLNPSNIIPNGPPLTQIMDSSFPSNDE